MQISEKIKNLNKKIGHTLDKLSKQSKIQDEDLLMLDNLSVEISKLAYENDMDKILTNDSHYLISWTDHFDDNQIVNNFKIALQQRPLEKPYFL